MLVNFMTVYGSLWLIMVTTLWCFRSGQADLLIMKVLTIVLSIIAISEQNFDSGPAQETSTAILGAG